MHHHLVTYETKNVPWHILAPAAVACDIYLIRRSAHPRGAFFLLYRKAISCKVKKAGQDAGISTRHLIQLLLPLSKLPSDEPLQVYYRLILSSITILAFFVTAVIYQCISAFPFGLRL